MYAWWGCVNVYLASRWEEEQAKIAERNRYRGGDDDDAENAGADPVVRTDKDGPETRHAKSPDDTNGGVDGDAKQVEPDDDDAVVASQPKAQ